MKLSYHQVCTLDKTNLLQDVLLAEKYGFCYMELIAVKLHEYLKNHSEEDLCKLFSEHKIKVQAINGFEIYEGFMCENDDFQKREALLKEVEFNCRIGQKIGAKALVINMPKNSFESGKPYEKEPEQILIDSTAILNCLCELAQKYGIGIGVEVIGSKRSSIRTVRQVNSLFKTVNYPNLGYVLDPYNLFTYDKTLTFDSILEADPTRIFAAHINQSEEDLPIHLLCKENRSLCDRGVMNIDRYMKNLQTIGYDGPVSIEVFPKDYWEDDAEWIVSECYKTTKAFMEKNGFIDTVC